MGLKEKLDRLSGAGLGPSAHGRSASAAPSVPPALLMGEGALAPEQGRAAAVLPVVEAGESKLLALRRALSQIEARHAQRGGVPAPVVVSGGGSRCEVEDGPHGPLCR